jgi:hypothetical protein
MDTGLKGHAIDAVLVLQRSDVPHIAAQRERYVGVPLLFTDPGTLDAAVQAGLGDYSLRRLDISPDLPADVYSEALHRSNLIDRLLTAERRALFSEGAGDDTPYTGWDQMLVYLSLQRAFMARAIGLCVAQQFPEARLGLLRPDNAQLMNFDSMLSAEMAAVDPARFCFIGRYDSGRFHSPQFTALAWHPQALPRQVQDQGVDAVVHIATCFYDAPVYGEAIRARFPAILDLPGTYCDVPVHRPNPLLVRIQDLPSHLQDPRALRYRERALAVCTEQLAAWVPNRAALAQQAALWADRSHQQAVNFLTLQHALQGHQPHFVVSDHDTGMNGPLYSVAAGLGSAITVLPHSGYATSALPHGRRVTAVEREGFGAAVRTMLGQPVAVRPVRFRSTPPAQPRASAARVCLLLNTMQSEGIGHVDFYPLVAFYRRLAALCAQAGADLQVRLKPSTPALSVVAGAFGQSPAWFQRTFARPIDEVAAEADLTIAYGEMTSGVATFLDAASLVLHASEQVWPADTLITPPYVRDGLVRSLNGEQALTDVAALLADPAHFRRVQGEQATAYAARRRHAHDDLFDDLPVPRPQPQPRPALHSPADELSLTET